MEDRFNTDSRFAYPLLSRLGLLFLLFFIGMFLSQGILQIWLIQDSQDLESILIAVRKGEQNGNMVILIMQAFNQIFGFGMSVFIAGKLNEDSREIMPVGKPDSILVLGAGAIVLLCFPVIPFMSWNADTFFLPESLKALETLLKEAESDAESLLYSLTKGENAVPKLSQILVFAGLPAICEELFFRGAIQQYFSKRFNTTAAVWITGLIFSVIHFQVYGFFARFLLGVLFGYFVVWSKSLIPAIWGHFVFNASSLYLSWENKDSGVESIERISWYWGLGALVVLVFLLILFRRYSLKHTYYEPEV